ncbi:hypothetical protein EOD10_17540 [Mesorhizobium sp. M7A.T.Ca.TU.009.01.3.2]|jgi:hypothetical protein|uniref:hypothetical protein n=1 Tax=unclassified Mesorhizobium TaxID=325217 RepID=UPI000FD5AFC2|nr:MULTISPECIES: hypothetical protein [unclassified Mesorhizobium]RUU12246.1 hypothetical protein EOD10_17540 [Mesorhizobium sp. M7A.T.Ca.TU.009.01.3.2]RUV09618.1 hypothetical protein EOD00_14990 [Mesorhizobium sp. M7A.T.Ca.TU.009.01.3.1]AZV19230.1 hypothetical protein EJ079_08995 [Mesorhizobium sp. M7A.F.Ce.TU.012.03.2.1]RUU82362.1 hypothetical protein EOC06_04540 [Mesorhizobium sp. M7A.F.Ca.MR.362.00.0.0]RWN41709.1 MAG: hypothetical protein EOS03_30015 [Mesorhizobium sp.]
MQRKFCCSTLQEVMTELPSPSFFETDDGVLMVTVGTVETEDGPGYFDQAVMFCPFCGTELQTDEIIAGKVKQNG